MRTDHALIRNRALLLLQRMAEACLVKPRLRRFYHICAGHIYFQTLRAAVDLGIFDLLLSEGPLTITRIAQRTGIEAKPARIILLGCVSLGLLKKKGELYRISRMSATLLASSSTRNIIPIIEWQHHINYHPMAKFTEALRENRNAGLDELPGNERTLYERLTHTPEKETVFQDAMRAISVQANHLLVRHVDFSRYQHVVDVGGGNGTNAINLANAFPHLKLTVFDSPSVCEIANANIRSHGLSDRINTVAGNAFTDPFPEADCFLFCHFMTIWSEEKNIALLRKAKQHLHQGGAVMIFNMMQHDDGSGPLSAAMGSPYFLTLATGEGMLYTWNEYESWLKDAGFQTARRIRLLMDHGVLVGSKPNGTT